LRLQTGIGIATGKVFSGIMGSMRKKEFTSVGRAVNIASRLQSLARGNEILLDEHTMEKVGHEIQATPLPPVSVKGLDAPLPIYSIEVG
jgi:adenylate cyclase